MSLIEAAQLLGRSLSKRINLEGYYAAPSGCTPALLLRSRALLLQLDSVYSADKLNNLKGQRERQGSHSRLSVEIITEPFNAV